MTEVADIALLFPDENRKQWNTIFNIKKPNQQNEDTCEDQITENKAKRRKHKANKKTKKEKQKIEPLFFRFSFFPFFCNFFFPSYALFLWLRFRLLLFSLLFYLRGFLFLFFIFGYLRGFSIWKLWHEWSIHFRNMFKRKQKKWQQQ